MMEAEWLACDDPQRLACEPVVLWTDEAILWHLRERGAAHLCGCWAVDLLLEKG